MLSDSEYPGCPCFACEYSLYIYPLSFAVCMYNEPGYALERTVQSLALQQADWNAAQQQTAAWSSVDPESSSRRLKHLLTWVMIDGWRRPDVMTVTQPTVVGARTRRSRRPRPRVSHNTDPSSSPGYDPAVDTFTVNVPETASVQQTPGSSAPPPIALESHSLLRPDSTANEGEADPEPVTTVTKGSRIMTSSAVSTIENLFGGDAGFGIPLEAKLERLFEEEKADYVILQYVEDGVLAPVSIPCFDAIHSVARRGMDGDVASPYAHLSDQDATFPLFISVLIKRDNGKKHDSHAIFFEAIAHEYTRIPTYKQSILYYFSTDVGALYGPNMMPILLGHLDKNPKCAGCCAHQRIMSYVDQAVPGTIEAENAFAAFLRAVQVFDVESGLASFNGVHASLQFLPVLPGPCSLFRACVITDSLLTEQRNFVTSPVFEDGLVSGNLKIAEDRIPSYLVLLQDDLPSETHWVPEACFFAESEDTLHEFIPQRRRWMNGTVAGYFWLVANKKLFAAALRMRLMAWKVFGLCILQLVIFLFIFSMPGQLVVTACITLLAGFSVLEGIGYDPAPSWVPYGLAAILWLAYVVSFATLTAAARWSHKSVIYWVSTTYNIYAHLMVLPVVTRYYTGLQVWYVRIFLNGFLMIINTSVLVAVVALSYSEVTTVFDTQTMKCKHMSHPSPPNTHIYTYMYACSGASGRYGCLVIHVNPVVINPHVQLGLFPCHVSKLHSILRLSTHHVIRCICILYC
jgi:cellulose synthase/poly-beta-1,6-N-acetylglucosamine synthase-like glycosyltransferase